MNSLFEKIIKGIEILLSALFKTVLACFSSRKFLAVIAGITATALATHGIVLSQDDINNVLTLFATFIGGQTIVDFKHASASVEMERMKLDILKLEIEKLNLLKEQNKNV